MLPGEEKFKEFIGARTERIANKIERTPMEKFFVFFLILITVSSVGLGYLQMKKNIESPLYSSYMKHDRTKILEKYNIGNLNIETSAETAKLQSQDSDLDGLDDFSEINIYSTSPYLEDTDGDGIKDKQEILNGTNPNCPEGQSCTVESVIPGGTEITAETNTNQPGYAVSLNANLTDLLDLETKLLSGEVTLEQLGITDPAMKQMLEIIQSGQATNTAELSPEGKAKALAELKDLTPEQIRQELIKRGVDQSLLQGVDDNTLQQLFLETLNIYNK
jgi:hypothetical protein